MTFSSLLFIIFIAVVGIQIAYYLAFLFSFSIKRSTFGSNKQIPLSVIICAKNEAQNLTDNLPAILNQDYKNFEIVLVNDSSSDKTLKVMRSFEKKHQNIKIVDVQSVEAFWGNKKYALTLGIKASKNEFLVFTDADCVPNSKHWLTQISSKFSNKKSIVLGFGGYAKKRFSFLNKLIRFETVLTALQYFSYANMGMPYMGVGRNMAYRKELFYNNSGFNSHTQLKSGDDDLFINEVATKTNVSICYTEESFTVSKPKTSFKNWILQKRRHVSTAIYYKPKHKFLLGLFYISQLLFWALAVVLFITFFKWQWVLAFVILRFLTQLLSLGLTAKKLKEFDLILLAPILEFFLILTQLSIFSANLISKPKHWK